MPAPQSDLRRCWLRRPDSRTLPSRKSAVNPPSMPLAPAMKGQRGPDRIPLVGGSATALSFQDHLDLLARWARARESRVVCVANVHMMVEARRNPDFAAVLAHADVVTPDGMPLVWLMRRRGAPRQERVAGMDLLPALCRRAAEDGIGVFFLGSSVETLTAIRHRLASVLPRAAWSQGRTYRVER